MAAFWDIAPCSLEVDRRFRNATCACHQGDYGDKHTTETSVYFNETTRRYIQEGCHFHTRRRENLKSHNFRSTAMFTHDSPSLVPTLSQMNPIHVYPPTLFTSNSLLLSWNLRPGLLSGSVNLNCVHTYRIFHACYMPHPSHAPWSPAQGTKKIQTEVPPGPDVVMAQTGTGKKKCVSRTIIASCYHYLQGTCLVGTRTTPDIWECWRPSIDQDIKVL
jgi:hypothetical protein